MENVKGERSERVKTRGLPDLCIDLFSCALQLRRDEEQADARALRRSLSEHFSRLDRRAKEAELDPENVSLAQYALVAFMDEIILTSSWSLRSEWGQRPLQLQYFNDFNAGEIFFSKLETLRGTKDPAKLDVLEIYATCLGLGFRGKLADPEGLQKPKLLAGEISREIKEARKQVTDELSTHWRPEERLEERVRRIPIWVVASVGMALLLVQTLLLDWKLKGEVRGFNSALEANQRLEPPKPQAIEESLKEPHSEDGQ